MAKIEAKLEKWDDETTLRNFLKFFSRVRVSTEFVTNDVGFITHEQLNIRCGELVAVSPPIALSWPLEPVAYPEETKGALN